MSWRPITFILTLVALMALVTWRAAAAEAHDGIHHRAVAALCASDLERYCSQDGGDRLICLARRAESLSPPCYRALRVAAIKDACEADYRRFCGHVLPGGGRVLACLRSNVDRLSEMCVRALRGPARRTSVSRNQGDDHDIPDAEPGQDPADPLK